MTQHRDDRKPAGSTDDTPHEDLGFAGRTAKAFINSPLSPLLFMSLLFMGVMGLVFTPRQEDPQISVPMVDIMIQYAGASAEQVASLAIEPLERIMSEIPGVDHVYSATSRGQGIVTVQFDVGEVLETSLVKLYDKLQSNMDKIPPGVSPPLVKPKGIDDVPVVTLTLWSHDVNDSDLRILALDVLQNLKEIENTGQGFVTGGRRQQVRVEVMPERLSGYGISLDQVANTIRTANSEKSVGGVETGDTHFNVVTGSFLRTAEDIERLVVGTRGGAPVYVRDLAKVGMGPEDASQLVNYYTGKNFETGHPANGVQAVTIALAKKVGTNGVEVANAIIDRANSLKNELIPANVQVAVTRDYGKTANDKVNSLIKKLFIATGWVFILVLLFFRSLRPAFVVLLVIPVVILFTVFIAWIMGYTVDRVSLFALIFSIGILVDDAIVVVENIYRRWLAKGETDAETAVDAVREVGNPTVLATLTVIAALLPMGFVRGMMGPYMEPIPALGSVAMVISLFAAFIFTPWLALRLKPSFSYLEKAERREHHDAQMWDKVYRKTLVPLIESPFKQKLFRLALWGAFAGACAMFYTTAVSVKMLPLDNKPEFSVTIDMPEGTALPVTANLVNQMAQKLRGLDNVVALQSYIGTARPFDFNGMVRHYYLRDKPWQAELQVQLTDKETRDESSHQIALAARELLTPLAKSAHANIAVVEMPPGPPVLQSVVAEVYGPDELTRRQVAADMTRMFDKAENITDVDNYMQQPFEYWRFDVDREKAVRRGISVDTINRNVAMAMGGHKLGDVKVGRVLEPTEIVIQIPLAVRSQIARLNDLPIPTADGKTLPLGELGRFSRWTEEPVIYHKDLRAVEYVVGDVTGRLAAPVYGMLQVEDQLQDYRSPDGQLLKTEWFGYPWFGRPIDDRRSGFEWGGEWTVTYETFRDMGMAFIVALILIYILVVWEFGNFRIPALIMAPIPLTLLGIIPGHWLWGAEFTATSMIGWIALAGIIVRNSILLVDFAIHEIRRGLTVQEAVLSSCRTRTRPIIITALALVAGSSVILSDPIFQGMAISLAFGVVVSTVLTLIVIPLGCIRASESLCHIVEQDGKGRCTAGGRRDVTEPQPTPRPLQPLALRVWSKLIDMLSMAFYLVRAIFIMIGEGIKSLLARKSAPVRQEAGPTSSSGTKPSPPRGGSAGGSSAPVGGGGSTPIGGGGAEPVPAQEAGSLRRTPISAHKPGSAKPVPFAQERAVPKPFAVDDSEPQEETVVEETVPAARAKRRSVTPSARRAKPKKTTVRSLVGNPPELPAGASAKSNGANGSKPAAAAPKKPDKAASAKAPKDIELPPVEDAQALTPPARPKRSARRGIRLKGSDPTLGSTKQ